MRRKGRRKREEEEEETGEKEEEKEGEEEEEEEEELIVRGRKEEANPMGTCLRLLGPVGHISDLSALLPMMSRLLGSVPMSA